MLHTTPLYCVYINLERIKKVKNVEQRRSFIKAMMMATAGGAALIATPAFASKKITTTVTLTEEQKDSIFFIYQEEKVARDVYITLGELYPEESTFAFIQLSEQRHMDAVRDLCIKYKIDISEVDESKVGEFVLPDLQEMYDGLIASGEGSLLDALYVGKLIEETDITDLEEREEEMPSDVVNTFESLKEGSYSHLDAFNVAIARES